LKGKEEVEKAIEQAVLGRGGDAAEIGLDDVAALDDVVEGDFEGAVVDAAYSALVLLDGADVEGVNAGAHEHVIYD